MPPSLLDLRRFVRSFILAYLISWPVWLGLSSGYSRFLGAMVNATAGFFSPEGVRQHVAYVDGDYFVHKQGRNPGSGMRVDARSIHFNWLLLAPLLVASRIVRRDAVSGKEAVRCALALAGVHFLFLFGVTEYRILRQTQAHPSLRLVLYALSQFYFGVGRIGLPFLIWVPVARRILRVAPPLESPRNAGE